METIKYSSYAQIERDLEILRVQREIDYQKIRFGVEKTKETIIPSNALSFIGNVYENVFSGAVGSVIKTIVPMAISWYVNRKRGD